MTFSVRQMIAAVVVSCCLGALMVPVATQGGQSNPAPAAANQPTFMIVEFMKVAQGRKAIG